MEAPGYDKLVEALRLCQFGECGCGKCYYKELKGDWCTADNHPEFFDCDDKLKLDAAATIEDLQSEVQFYEALADEWQSAAKNKERLLGIYRAEQAKRFYSATDDNGRVITNPCDCTNIPVLPDSSEIPNS